MICLKQTKVTEWIISGNPEQYNVVDAFHNLHRVDWTQKANMTAGDIVYIYVSGNVKAIKFKCRVTKADLDEPDIDDREYDLSDQFDGTAGRYMELELIEEYAGDEYSGEELMKHGFRSSKEPIRMPESVKQYLESIVGNNSKIDYIGVLDYLRDNAGVPYSNPDALGLPPKERNRLLEVKEKGQNAIAVLNKMAEAFDVKFKLNKWVSIRWLDGSNTKTRGYLWAPLKFENYAANPVSVSVFVEKNDSDTRYRVSLEIKNDGTDGNSMKRYHSHLDIPLNVAAGLVYVSGSNEWGNPDILNKTQDEIKQEVESGKLKKVQICKYIDRKPDETNAYYHTEITKAIDAILPYYEHVLMEEIKALEERGVQEMKEANKEFDKNLILYGPPGTGKTYNSATYAVAICDGKSVDELTDYDAVMKRYNELKEAGRIAFTTFHQSYGYEEFIEGIKPVVDDETTDISYTIESGVFKKFCDVARTPEKNEKPYVFIIDEINRGNISKIFGELITLIESTKRAGMEEAASAILPYSGKPFSVPSNVYILGTMNTADRSIALLDTALRRRFQFIEMMPDSGVLRKIHADKVEDLDVAAVLDKINERVIFLYDREHTIGHAFFTGLKDDATLAKLQSIFEKSVIPLLQEYFYEDYQKIQLVLGDNAKSDDNLKFILNEKVVAKNIFKGNVEDVIDLPEKRYSINKVAFGNINSYKEIL